MKAKIVIVLGLAFFSYGQQSTGQKPELKTEQKRSDKQAAELEKLAQNQEKQAGELEKMDQMKAHLQELQNHLLSEKTVLEEQARVAQEYAKRALDLQRSLNQSPERQAELSKMQFEMQKELSLAGLYNDRFLKVMNERQIEQNNQIMELEAKCIELSFAFKKNKESEKQQAIEKELALAVNQLFDLRETQREQNIQRMDKDLAQMKMKLAERRAQKSQIVKKRLEQLLGKKDDLDW